jgi:hypothetical protein
MLFFCISFLVAQTARDWLWEVERLLIGPRDLEEVWWPLSGPLSVLNDAVGVVLLAALLAAAVDRVLRLQPAPSADSASESTPEDGAQDVASRA